MIHLLLTLLLGPLLLLQGKWTRWTTPVLPEPPGPRHGQRGEGPVLRLLLLGDSAAAGVGASHQDEALLGQVLAHLARHRRVHYALDAVTGATTADTLARLSARPDGSFDVVATSLGVNDLTRSVGLRTWVQQQRALRQVARERFGVTRFIACGLPPVAGFFALPQPLRWYLGRRAVEFSRALEASVAAEPDVVYLHLDVDRSPENLATDGFHPGPVGYAAWGEALARVIADERGGP